MPITINGVTHPLDSDPKDPTGTTAGSGDLGALAATAGAAALTAAGVAEAVAKAHADTGDAATLAAANAYADDLAQSGTSGTGIQNVSGTVDLTNEPGIYEVYATAAATVEGVSLAPGDAAVFRYLGGNWSFMVLGAHTSWQPAPGTPPEADTTPPTGATLAVTGTGANGDTATLTVSGAFDSGTGLHPTPYAFSIDGGSTWTAYQASPTHTTAALTTGTYQPRVRVRDAASPTPNVATFSAADWVVVGPTLPFIDTFTAPDSTSVGGRSIGGFTWGNSATEVVAFIGRAGAGIADIVGNKAVSTSANARGAIIDVGTPVVKISAKVSAASGTTGRIRIGVGTSINGGAGNNGLYLDYASNTFSLRWSHGGTAVALGTRTVARPVTDLPVSLEFDGTTAVAFVDGVAVGSGAVSFDGQIIGFELANEDGLALDDFIIEEALT